MSGRADLDACVCRYGCRSEAHLSDCPEHPEARVVPDLLGKLQRAVEKAKADWTAPAPLDIESVLELETLARTIYEASSDGADAAWMDVCRLGLDALYQQQAEAVADQIRAAVGAHVAAARAEALREAADRWAQGAWSDVMLPKPTPPAVPVIAYSNRVGDWLRARADALTEPSDGEGS